MKFVIQRVTQAKVDIDQVTHGQINKGLLVLIGVHQNDTQEIAAEVTSETDEATCESDGKTVYTIEGNSGDSFRQRSYPLGYYEILGYGIPVY